jgi:preprotein translocase subunit YajC
MAAMVASGYDVLTSLLPFVLLFGFWIFLMKNVRGRLPTQYQPLVDKLEEIRAELERLRKAVEEREPEGDRFGFRS